MRVVIALGGNALLERGQLATASNQRMNAFIAAKSISSIAEKHDIIVVHGNGPQVGLLALQSEAYGDKVPPYPLDILNAESQGMIGCILQQEMMRAMSGKKISTILTQVVVDKNDKAFSDPQKPIGPVYSKDQAEELAMKNDWTVAEDGKYYRRVVPSPFPKEIVEIGSIKCLLDGGIIPICVGGGGIPVIKTENGYEGVEAVIDKDRAASLLAGDLGADCLVILTDVDGVYLDWGKSSQRKIDRIGLKELTKYSFASGSMGPKIQAAKDFIIRNRKGFAVIGNLSKGLEMVEKKAGTVIFFD